MRRSAASPGSVKPKMTSSAQNTVFIHPASHARVIQGARPEQELNNEAQTNTPHARFGRMFAKTSLAHAGFRLHVSGLEALDCN